MEMLARSFEGATVTSCRTSLSDGGGCGIGRARPSTTLDVAMSACLAGYTPRSLLDGELLRRLDLLAMELDVCYRWSRIEDFPSISA